MSRLLLAFVLISINRLTIASAATPDPTPLISALRSSDQATFETLLRQPGAVTERDARGNTPLHWAAIAKDPRRVQFLLNAGADPRATNAVGATPLHYGTGSSRIVRLLLQAGADPKAKSLNGATPLHSAAARPNGYESLRLLLAAGANPTEPRSLFPAGVTVPISDPALLSISPLALAIYYGDMRSAKLLLELGTELGGAKGMTPVAAAAFSGRGNWVEILARKGGEMNFDEGFVGHSLNNLLYADHRQFVPTVIEHGADLHQTTSIGERTPPMVWSSYTETADLSVTKALLAKGLNINEPTAAGHTALDWAMKRGETPLVAFLRSQGATNSPQVQRLKELPRNPVPSDSTARSTLLRNSIQRAVTLLQRSSDGFLDNGFARQSGCVSCHHQTLPAIAFGRARVRGFLLDEASLARQLHAQHTAWSKGRDAAYEVFEPQPDSPANLGYGLMGLKSLGYSPDELTDAMVWFLANSQLENGAFPAFDRRPPLEQGQIVGTAFAIGALRQFPQPIQSASLDRHFARARGWLRTFQPSDPNQRIHRLLALGWAGAKAAELKRFAGEILAEQAEDGGWAPLPTLPSDAWMTGLTLFVLQEVGCLSSHDSAYRRGADYLLRTQFRDGSWWVPSRTWPLQPHFDSGFPHGKDQWISAGATTWAALALMNEIPPASTLPGPSSAQALMAKFPQAPIPSQPPVSTQPATTPDSPSPANSDALFSQDILPILQRSCTGCHSGNDAKGGLSLQSLEGIVSGGQSGNPSVVPGNPDASPIIRFALDQVEDLEMPPLSKRSKFPSLTPDEVETIRRWIAKLPVRITQRLAPHP